MNCPKCKAPLSPKTKRCASCHSLASPWFNRILPWALGLLAVYGLCAGIYGGIEANELGQALAVMIPMSGLAVGIALGLFFGATAAWHVWTFLLGIGLFGGMAALISVDAGDSAGIFLVSSLVYAGIGLRTHSKITWAIVSVVYVALAALAVFPVFTKVERVADAIGICVLVCGIASLSVWTYSVGVRWWYNVRLGWFGAHIGELTTGEQRANNADAPNRSPAAGSR